MTSKRKSIPKGLRFEVFKRDGFVCQYCGSHPPKAILHADHITPVKLGGENVIDNLITACSTCNQGKSATPLTLIPRPLAEKAEDMQEREAQIAGYVAIMQAARDRLERDSWVIAEHLSPGASEGYNTNSFNSIKRFVDKLGIFEVLESAEIANDRYPRYEKKAFLYFCGICWRKIREAEGG